MDGRVFERYSIPQRIGDSVVGRVWSFRDVTERERLLRRATFLSDATRLLASLDVEKALEGVAHLAVPYLGDACAIDLLREGGVRRLLLISRDPTRQATAELEPTALAGHTSTYSLNEIAHLAVPLVHDDEVLGVMTFIASPQRCYNQPDVEVAEELARRVALSIMNARLYRDAREALRARDEFLAVAAHELRGPVASLHVAVQLLSKGNLPPKTMAKLLATTERSDRRLSQFVDELLDVGHARAGHLHLTLEMVDLGDAVRAAASRFNAEIARSGSTLSLTIDGHVVGRWDRLRLEQVAGNLISNALKFGLGRPIHVSVTANNGRAALVVTDEGMGVPPDMRARIFDPFERAVSARHFGGLGLGLYIVRTIVSGMGGTIELESELGKGSTFTVRFPQERSE
jgi:signal transduction histidine kinase